MNRNTRNIKILILTASLVVLMLALCGCRTRVTNNSEVTNVMYDESGYMQEDYQMRRDELDLSTADEPIFKGLSKSGTEDAEYSGDDSESLDYDSEDEEEDDYEDPEEPDASGTGTSPSTDPSSGGTSTRRVVRRTPIRTNQNTHNRTNNNTNTNNTKKDVTVTFNANGGKCSTKSIKIKTGTNYGTLPKASRDGYDFSGWYTKKEGGKKVSSKTKMGATRNHTLYAHWKTASEDPEPKPEPKPEPEPEPEKKKYKVSFEVNGEGGVLNGDDIMEVEEGGKYGSLPDAEREGFKFEGWFTSAEGGTRIKSGSSFTGKEDHTLYAHWSKDNEYYYNIWNEELKAAAKAVDAKYKIHDGDGGSFLQDCGLKSGDGDDYDYLVFFGTKEKAEEIDNPEGKPVLVIPNEARKSSTKENNKLLYKLKVYNLVANEESQLNTDLAAEELDVTDLDEVTILESDEG